MVNSIPPPTKKCLCELIPKIRILSNVKIKNHYESVLSKSMLTIEKVFQNQSIIFCFFIVLIYLLVPL